MPGTIGPRLTSQIGTSLPAWRWTSPSEHISPRVFPSISWHRAFKRRINHRTRCCVACISLECSADLECDFANGVSQSRRVGDGPTSKVTGNHVSLAVRQQHDLVEHSAFAQHLVRGAPLPAANAAVS